MCFDSRIFSDIMVCRTPYALLLTAITVWSFASSQSTSSVSPHIIVFLIDDLGWNEVGFRNPEFSTPTIDKLASEGVVLNYMYAQPSCTMSRAALLTGRYPHTMGIEKVFSSQDNCSIPLDIKLLPQYLKDQGYQTHAIGKWHLGMCDKCMMPTRRGFDTFNGCLHGNSDHYLQFPKNPYDFWSNETLDHSVQGQYDTEVLTERAVNIIKSHKESGTQEPFFMYLAHKAVHTPIEVPRSYTKRCSSISDTLLKDRCGMLAAVDDSMKNITDTLERLGYMDEPLLIVVMSDNGGSTPNGASNWPLRGKKATPFEGGTRVPAFLHSRRLLPNAPSTYNGLLHITDWLPSLLQLVSNSAQPPEFENIDGIKQWIPIKRNITSNRDRLVYELWEEEAGVRVGNKKMVYHQSGGCSGWYNPPPDVDTTLPQEIADCTGFMLFDLETDPNEINDLSQDPNYAQDMVQLLEYYNSEMARRVSTQICVVNPNKLPDDADWQPGWCQRC